MGAGVKLHGDKGSFGLFLFAMTETDGKNDQRRTSEPLNRHMFCNIY